MAPQAMVDLQEELLALVKKEISRFSLNPGDLMGCNWIIYQESPCSSTTQSW